METKKRIKLLSIAVVLMMLCMVSSVSAERYEKKAGSEKNFNGVKISTVKDNDKYYSYNTGKASILVELDGYKTRKEAEAIYGYIKNVYAPRHNLQLQGTDAVTENVYIYQIWTAKEGKRVAIATVTDFNPDQNHYKAI